MLANLLSLGRLILGTLRDLAPIILVIAFFQIAVLQQPVPNLDRILGGLALVMVGLALFVQGLEMGLFPIGQAMAEAFARKGSLAWLLAFAFALGFGTTVAEPALIAVAGEAAEAAAEAGLVAAEETALEAYATGLRLTVALSVGVASGGNLLLVAAAGIMLAAGLCACIVPASRALRIHPVEALRHD